MLEHDWSLTALIWPNWLFRVQTVQCDLSDYKQLQLDRQNRTVKQPIKNYALYDTSQ